MSPAALIAGLASRGVSVTLDGDSLLVRPASKLDAGARALLAAHKPALVAYLSSSIPSLPWQLERLVSAAANGVLRAEVAGVHDVSRYVLAWACAYLTGDRDEALRRLWEVHAAWQGRERPN